MRVRGACPRWATTHTRVHISEQTLLALEGVVAVCQAREARKVCGDNPVSWNEQELVTPGRQLRLSAEGIRDCGGRWSAHPVPRLPRDLPGGHPRPPNCAALNTTPAHGDEHDTFVRIVQLGQRD